MNWHNLNEREWVPHYHHCDAWKIKETVINTHQTDNHGQHKVHFEGKRWKIGIEHKESIYQNEIILKRKTVGNMIFNCILSPKIKQIKFSMSLANKISMWFSNTKNSQANPNLQGRFQCQGLFGQWKTRKTKQQV